MKYITKNAAPKDFLAWLALANENWQPTYRDLCNPEKSLVIAALINEQGHICCYCGVRIESNNCHIDHLIPQSLDRTLDLAYENFLASCTKEPSGKLPLHCGHAVNAGLRYSISLYWRRRGLFGPGR